jgi:hypothetical protein
MAWRAITEADVETVLLGPELESFRSVAGAADGTADDKLAEIIATVTDECRAHIEDCATNKLGPAGTLPERVIHHALAIIRTRLLSRINLEQGETRAGEHKEAVAFFLRVADCKVKIEKPDPAEIVEEANTPSMETVTRSDPKMSKEQLGRLF